MTPTDKSGGLSLGGIDLNPTVVGHPETLAQGTRPHAVPVGAHREPTGSHDLGAVRHTGPLKGVATDAPQVAGSRPGLGRTTPGFPGKDDAPDNGILTDIRVGVNGCGIPSPRINPGASARTLVTHRTDRLAAGVLVIVAACAFAWAVSHWYGPDGPGVASYSPPGPEFTQVLIRKAA